MPAPQSMYMLVYSQVSENIATVSGNIGIINPLSNASSREKRYLDLLPYR